mmetsp:Transcript_39740/g.94380  ORF Transcript_39740/g.94380 Transcript_39740/m.94380 type:complete len:246 (+) Transcript_39740:2729-3466(+)
MLSALVDLPKVINHSQVLTDDRQVLREVPNPCGLADLDGALSRLEPASQDVQQRRLARAVRAHDTDLVPGLEDVVDAVKKREPFPCVATALQLYHTLPLALHPAGAEAQAGVLGGSSPRRSRELMERRDSCPRLGAAGLWLPCHPRGLPPQHGLCVPRCSGLRSPPLRPRLLDPGVAPRAAKAVDVAAAVSVELEHPRAHGLHEAPVVRHHDNGRRRTPEPPLHPPDDVEVHVVRWLVEEDQPGL